MSLGVVRPTLTLAADPTFDVVVFECDHGRTEASGPSTTLGESSAIIEATLHRHKATGFEQFRAEAGTDAAWRRAGDA